MVITAQTTSGYKKWTGPSYWADPLLTVGLFQDMSSDWDGHDIIKLFSLLYKADYNLIFNAPDELGAKVFPAIEFMYDNPIEWANLPVPKLLRLKDELGNPRILVVPENVGRLSFGQTTMLAQQIQKHKAKGIEGSVLSYAAALYFYGAYYGDTNIDPTKLKTLEDMIKRQQILDIYPISFFLLNPPLNFGRRLVSKLESIWVSLPLVRQLMAKRWRKNWTRLCTSFSSRIFVERLANTQMK